MTTENQKVPKRIAQTVLQSLKGGVVPRIGLPYITVGRKNEIQALLRDVDIISEGGAAFRFIVGRYGCGKSFLLQAIRSYVMDRGFIVADADLSPERRLQGTKGQGLATYRELIGNLSTKTKPEGSALTLVLDRWINNIQNQTLQETGFSPEDPALTAATDQKIFAITDSMSEMVHGFSFARLLSDYYHAYIQGDEATKGKVVRWFRGEYSTKREAREDKRRGIYSYEALRSRLTEGRFSAPGTRDLLAPVIRLDPLRAEEMLVLCEKLAQMHAGLYSYPRNIATGDLADFIKIEYERIGADTNITPREVIRDFISLLDLLYQNPDATIASLLSSEEFSYAPSQALPEEAQGGFATFTL